MGEDGNGDGLRSTETYVSRGEFMEYKQRIESEFIANGKEHNFIIEKIDASGQSIRNAVYFTGAFITLITAISMYLSFIGVI